MKEKTNDKTKRERKVLSTITQPLRRFWSTVKKVKVPTIGQWWHSFWRVVLIVLIFATVLSVIDYFLIQGTFGLQGVLPEVVESRNLSIGYLVALILAGILSVTGVLFQQGSSDGLTSLLGSGSQYQGSIAGAVKKISKFTLIVGIIFLALCLFSPMFLGGLY